MKRFVGLILSFTMLVSAFSYSAMADDGISIIVNGEEISFSEMPYIEDGVTMVPMRAIFEALGAEVNFDVETKEITAKLDENNIKFFSNSKIAIVNGQTKSSAKAVKNIDGTTMIPLRFVSEALGAIVDWDQDTKVIEINTRQIYPLVDDEASIVTDESLDSVEYTTDRIDSSVKDSNYSVIVNEWYDKIVIKGDSQVAAKINAAIEKDYENFLSDDRLSENSAGATSKNQFYNTVSATVTKDSDGILSIQYTKKWYAGGSANEDYYGLNFDLSTGEKLSLTKVFNNSEEYVSSYLKAAVLKYIDMNSKSIRWWGVDDIGDVSNAKEIVSGYGLDDYSYYVKDKKVYLCYETYLLAPGSEGCIVIACDIK